MCSWRGSLKLMASKFVCELVSIGRGREQVSMGKTKNRV